MRKQCGFRKRWWTHGPEHAGHCHGGLTKIAKMRRSRSTYASVFAAIVVFAFFVMGT